MENVVTIPYSPRSQFIESIHSNTKRWKVCVAHRRSGKSVAAINELIKQALMKQNGRFAYIGPTYTQTKDIVWDYLRNFAGVIPGIQFNIQELRCDFPNGSRVRLYGSDNPDSLRGIGLDGVVFDEYAQVKPNMFPEVIRPALADKQGWAIFLGTPKGRNHFWELYMKSKTDEEWSSSLYRWQDTKALPQSEIDSALKDSPADFFRQEYECEFLEGAGQFFRRISENIQKDSRHTDCRDFQIGVDLAKYQDWTVISPFCLNHFHALEQERFNQIDYNLQKSKIEATYLRYQLKGSAKVVIDSTGVGEPVFDDLRAKGINIEPFKFTQISREQLLRNLQILLEQDRIKIPNDEGLIGELQSTQYALKQNGVVKIEVPHGVTDDRIMALALSVWEAQKMSTMRAEVPKIEYDLYGRPTFQKMHTNQLTFR